MDCIATFPAGAVDTGYFLLTGRFLFGGCFFFRFGSRTGLQSGQRGLQPPIGSQSMFGTHCGSHGWFGLQSGIRVRFRPADLAGVFAIRFVNSTSGTPSITFCSVSRIWPTGQKREKTHGNICPLAVTASFPLAHAPHNSSNWASALRSFCVEPRPTPRTRSAPIFVRPIARNSSWVRSVSPALSLIVIMLARTDSRASTAHRIDCRVRSKLPVRCVTRS
jgi:hypothetical protein